MEDVADAFLGIMIRTLLELGRGEQDIIIVFDPIVRKGMLRPNALRDAIYMANLSLRIHMYRFRTFTP